MQVASDLSDTSDIKQLSRQSEAAYISLYPSTFLSVCVSGRFIACSISPTL